MTLASTEKDEFLDLLSGIWEALPKEDPLSSLRKQAWDQFITLGLPNRDVEVYRYIKLRQLFANSFRNASAINLNKVPSPLRECKQSYLVLVNGVYQPSLSNIQDIPSKVTIGSLSQSIKTFGAFINNSWSKMLKEEKDPFALLNGALHNGGLFIYVPPKVVLEAPIEIVNIVTADQSSIVTPRIHVYVGSQSEITIINTEHVTNITRNFVNQVIEFRLDEDAHVNFSTVQDKKADDSWHFEAIRASLKRDAGFTSIFVNKGSATTRNDYRVELCGENSEALLNGLWMLDNRKESHTNIHISHLAPYCRSYQLFKGVLNGNSRSSFEGKIVVKPEAQKTEAFQANHNLLLSEHAHADSAPNLEIFADDVKASHGATVGQLDQDQLFYMKTRGIPADSAKRLLVKGFCLEVLDKLNVESLRNIFNE